jgi:7-cyano-7-deazaguanine synthase
MKKLLLTSGGMDSLAIALDYLEEYGPDNIISLGFNYGQRHFKQENAAATRFCDKHKIRRVVLDVPISQIGGCSLIDHDIPVTTDMEDQRSTVVPQRNAIFCLFAAAFAQENGCDEVVHGACVEDYEAYRDCRPEFFTFLESAIQAGRTEPVKGSEYVYNDVVLVNVDVDDLKKERYAKVLDDRLDIQIKTPLINFKKEETVKRIIELFGVDVYADSYTCYNGGELHCGECPACRERLAAFEANGAIDPVRYIGKD